MTTQASALTACTCEPEWCNSGSWMSCVCPIHATSCNADDNHLCGFCGWDETDSEPHAEDCGR